MRGTMYPGSKTALDTNNKHITRVSSKVFRYFYFIQTCVFKEIRGMETSTIKDGEYTSTIYSLVSVCLILITSHTVSVIHKCQQCIV